MSTHTDLRDYVLEDAAIAAAVGAAVYPDHLPQSTDFPAIVFQVISRTWVQHLAGIAAAGSLRVQWDVYAATHAAAEAVAELLVARFRSLAAACPTTIGGASESSSESDSGTAVCDVEIQGPRSRADAPDDGSDQWTYVAGLDTILWIG